MEEITVSKAGPIARLALNRPDKRNAQTPAMWRHLAREVGPALCADREIRVLIVEGRGSSFSAGIDIANFTGGGGGIADPAGSRGPAEDIRGLQAGFEWIETAPFLSIAKVQGHALGGGMQLALACDLRFAADDVKMGLAETNWGLAPDLGGTVWLPRLVGPAKALELIVTAETLRAPELLALGIVNRVVPVAELDAAVDAFAQLAASRPPLAVRAAKNAIRAGWGRPTVDGMISVAHEQVACIQSADFREAARAFLEKRAPNYQGR
jgi:enoyl-CoA hydratase/carnithine racemase